MDATAQVGWTLIVSIHAHPRRNARSRHYRPDEARSGFQSTRIPEGMRDRALRRRRACRRRFNPRASPKECAIGAVHQKRRSAAVSIHAHPRRNARFPRIIDIGDGHLVSIHAHPRRNARCRLSVFGGASQRVSIHAHPRRNARSELGVHPDSVAPFQSTRIPEGMRDVRLVCIECTTYGFNPRASPKECAILRRQRLRGAHLVSIHAHPRRNARFGIVSDLFPVINVSIHAHPRRNARFSTFFAPG